MPDSAPFSPSDSMLADVLAVSLTGLVVLRPVLGTGDEATNFVFDYLNPPAQRLLGLPERPPYALLTHFPVVRSSGLLEFCQQVYATGQARDDFSYYASYLGQQFRLGARRSGEYLLVSLVALPALETTTQAQAASEARGLSGYGEAWRQHQQLYHMLEQAPAMICVFDGPQHVFQFVNPPYQALVGERPLVGKPIAEAMPELRDQPVFALLDQVYQTGETFYANEMLMQLDHHNSAPTELEKRYYNFIYQARRNSAGAIDGIFVFAYDVTPQVQARQQMQVLNDTLEKLVVERTREANAARLAAEQQRAQLDRLFMQAPGAICVLDGHELVYQLVNPAYQQIFPGRVLLGKPLFEALPELRASPIPAIIKRVYTTGESFVANELPLQLARTEGGPLEDIFWTFTYQARRNALGHIDGVLVFAYDVTEQVKARRVVETTQQQTQLLADKLSLANTQLTRTNVDLDNFIYTASHDLKAPISNIEGLLHALRQELELPPAQADTATVLHLMQDSIRRFQRTIAYLTDVSKLQKAYDQPAADVVLADLIEAVRLDIAPQLAASGGELLVEVSDCHTVAFAEKNLRSIVYNLLSNALKYQAPGRPPHVRVQCHATGQFIVLEVQDNGLGLTPEQQAKLFGMFQRMHDHVEGTGIGLYMVKKIVENAGGHIEVDSQLSTGSTFRVFLPKFSAAAPAAV